MLGPDVLPPDAVGEKLAEPYRQVALHLAVLGDPERHKRLREAFAGEIAAQFPQLMGGVPQMSPPVGSNFVGREDEIAALKAAMLRSASEPELVTVVTGPAGIGKSMVVARACRDLGIDTFPHGILWVRPAEVATPELAQQWLRTRFGEKQIGERALREKLKDRRFLIVVDDVRVASDVAYILRFGERCARVVITRDVGLLSGTPGPRIFIGPLTSRRVTRWSDAGRPPSVMARCPICRRAAAVATRLHRLCAERSTGAWRKVSRSIAI